MQAPLTEFLSRSKACLVLTNGYCVATSAAWNVSPWGRMPRTRTIALSSGAQRPKLGVLPFFFSPLRAPNVYLSPPSGRGPCTVAVSQCGPESPLECGWKVVAFFFPSHPFRRSPSRLQGAFAFPSCPFILISRRYPGRHRHELKMDLPPDFYKSSKVEACFLDPLSWEGRKQGCQDHII